MNLQRQSEVNNIAGCCRQVRVHGPGNWSKLLPHFPGRIGKQLRERWNHELRPDINKQGWQPAEEMALVAAHRTAGNCWADIAKVFHCVLLALTCVSKWWHTHVVCSCACVHMRTCMSILARVLAHMRMHARIHKLPFQWEMARGRMGGSR